VTARQTARPTITSWYRVTWAEGCRLGVDRTHTAFADTEAMLRARYEEVGFVEVEVQAHPFPGQVA
jgi:hypothetical protein